MASESGGEIGVFVCLQISQKLVLGEEGTGLSCDWGLLYLLHCILIAWGLFKGGCRI